MRRCSVEFSASYNCFEIWSDDPIDPTHFRKSVDFIDGRAFVAQCVLQGFDGDINADLVTVLETIGNWLRGAVDADGNAFNGVRLDSLSESFPGETNDAE